MRPWIIDFYVRGQEDGGGQDYFIKVMEKDLQHAITEACHLINKVLPKTEYFVHTAGLALDDSRLGIITQRTDGASGKYFDWQA